MRQWIPTRRLTVVTGHYGSGKTELAVNLALALADAGEETALADLDTVNPYFCSREKAALLAARGIHLIAGACTAADVPTVPPEVNALLQPDGPRAVLDIGGDHTGARVLPRYRSRLAEAELLLVVNANRPLTSTGDGAARYVDKIQETTGLKVTGLVNNTHMCTLTTREDICRGAELADTVSRLTGVPVACHMAVRHLAETLGDLDAPVFPIDLWMNRPWEPEPGLGGQEGRQYGRHITV